MAKCRTYALRATGESRTVWGRIRWELKPEEDDMASGFDMGGGVGRLSLRRAQPPPTPAWTLPSQVPDNQGYYPLVNFRQQTVVANVVVHAHVGTNRASSRGCQVHAEFEGIADEGRLLLGSMSLWVAPGVLFGPRTSAGLLPPALPAPAPLQLLVLVLCRSRGPGFW
ncbi:hypothetical protein HDU90_003533 [Geranomyces variabilis]|nr:hypothetical protein HDU90_003533 [Geranomyces variabilis]